MKLNRRNLFAWLAAIPFAKRWAPKPEPELLIEVNTVFAFKPVDKNTIVPVLFKRYKAIDGKITHVGDEIINVNSDEVKFYPLT